MSRNFVKKYPTDEFDVLLRNVNADESITYTVASVDTVTSINKETEADSTSILIDTGLTDYDEDMTIIWLKDHASQIPGDIHLVTVISTMVTGQEFTHKFEVLIV